MSATRHVWDLAGRPAPAVASVVALLSDRAGDCAICGQQEAVTADVNKALGANFADRGHLARGDTDRVCAGCLWCCSGKPPATLRMWTILAAPGVGPSHPKAWLQDTPGLQLINRSNPRPVIDLLSAPPAGPWVLSVATSGQKHVLPYAHVNHGDSWTVRMETTSITATTADWRHVHQHALALRRLGVPADAIPAREPRFIKTLDQLAQWRTHDQALAGWHQSPLLQLALWTLTKGTIHADS